MDRLNPWRLARSLVVVCGLAASVATADRSWGQPADRTVKAAKSADSIPIRKITLYRSGVGYFERTGSVEGDAELQLRFKTEQINDILKSMVLLDLDHGRIDAVSYGSKEPLARRLASFGVDISANPSIPDLLNQLRGAAIRVSAGEQTTGTILGIENRLVPGGKELPPRNEPYLNLVTPTGLKSIAIADITSFDLLDKELAGELGKALAALAEYRADRSKTVDLKFAGAGTTGPRRIVVGYVHEMPVWKTSYRLILPEEPSKKDDASKPKGTSLSIQGWAIVENNTDQDWDGVRLALVSGRPVSFQMDLYEPLFVARPLIPVPTVPGVSPRAYQGGTNVDLGLALAKAAEDRKPGTPQLAGTFRRVEEVPKSEPFGTTGGPGGAGGASKAAFYSLSAADMDTYGARAQAQAGEVGEVFQYELEAPVTIERQRSAMIPIMSAAVTGRRVSIFNSADGSEHPMRGVELKNDSNLQLLPGPIAVFDGGDGQSAYAGDAQIGHITQGDKRLLAYAVDLDVSALTSGTSTSTVTKLKIVDGMFEQTVVTQSSDVYAFKNADAKRSRSMIVEHMKFPGWRLVKPEKSAEETQELYRFEMQVGPGKTETLTVAQERVEAQRVGLMSIDMPTLLTYRKDGKISEKAMETIRDLGARQARIAESQRGIQELDRQMTEISQDQGRIRENMSKIDGSSQLYARYMTKLSEQETKLEDLTERRKQNQASVDKMQSELNEYIRTLNVD